jgi:outer membrane lipoprotein-sorting protein
MRAQSIVGSWQLVKQSNCMEENMTAANDTAQRMLEDMKDMGSASAQVVVFKEKMSGEEYTRILTKKRTTNNKNFLYRFDGETLMILDKKSQTLTNSYMVDKFSADSLIISNSTRPCETRIFLRLK